MPLRKMLEHAGERFSRASERALYAIKESRLRIFEEPSASNYILALNFEGDDQTPERLQSEAKNSTRMNPGTYAGRIDHGEKKLGMEIRCPRQLTGSDTLMGDVLFEGLMGTGSRHIPAAQAAVDIDSIVSHSRTSTKLRVTAALTDFLPGDVVALRSQQASTAGANNQPVVIMNVEDATGGQVDLTCKPGFLLQPATTDKIQGGVTWKAVRDWTDTFSFLASTGFDGDQLEGSVVPMGSFNIDGRTILKSEFGVHYKRAIYSSIAFVLGTTEGAEGDDDFLATDTILKTDDSYRFDPAASTSNPILVNLEKWDCDPASGTYNTLLATETKAKITSVDNTNRRLTFIRGGTPIAVSGAAQGLKARTGANQEFIFVGITTIAGDYVEIELDNRGVLRVPLTVIAASGYTLAQAKLDIKAAIAGDVRYAQNTQAPYIDIDWENAIGDDGAGALRMTSMAWGSQSQCRAYKSSDTHNRYDDFWDAVNSPSGFDVRAAFEVQIVPYTPGGSETRDVIINKDSVCITDGYRLVISQANVTIDNAAEHLEDLKTGDDYELGALEGYVRKVTAAMQTAALGWTARLRVMAIRDEGLFVSFVVGDEKGATLSIHFPKAKTTAPVKSGDNRQDKAWTFTAENPRVSVVISGVTYIVPEVIIGLT